MYLVPCFPTFTHRPTRTRELGGGFCLRAPCRLGPPPVPPVTWAGGDWGIECKEGGRGASDLHTSGPRVLSPSSGPALTGSRCACQQPDQALLRKTHPAPGNPGQGAQGQAGGGGATCLPHPRRQSSPPNSPRFLHSAPPPGLLLPPHTHTHAPWKAHSRKHGPRSH